jgi:hypothetical protein
MIEQPIPVSAGYHFAPDKPGENTKTAKPNRQGPHIEARYDRYIEEGLPNYGDLKPRQRIVAIPIPADKKNVVWQTSEGETIQPQEVQTVEDGQNQIRVAIFQVTTNTTFRKGRYMSMPEVTAALKPIAESLEAA